MTGKTSRFAHALIVFSFDEPGADRQGDVEYEWIGQSQGSGTRGRWDTENINWGEYVLGGWCQGNGTRAQLHPIRGVEEHRYRYI